MLDVVLLGLEQCGGVLVDRDGVDLIALSDFVHDILSGDDLAENSVLTVEVWGGKVSDEKLAAIGVRPGIRHGKNSRLGVLERVVDLIGEFVARAARAGASRIAALDHEISDHAVEGYTVIVAAFRKVEEICARDGDL